MPVHSYSGNSFGHSNFHSSSTENNLSQISYLSEKNVLFIDDFSSNSRYCCFASVEGSQATSETYFPSFGLLFEESKCLSLAPCIRSEYEADERRVDRFERRVGNTVTECFGLFLV